MWWTLHFCNRSRKDFLNLFAFSIFSAFVPSVFFIISMLPLLVRTGTDESFIKNKLVSKSYFPFLAIGLVDML